MLRTALLLSSLLTISLSAQHAPHPSLLSFVFAIWSTTESIPCPQQHRLIYPPRINKPAHQFKAKDQHNHRVQQQHSCKWRRRGN